MNNEELKKILGKHLHWILEDCKGWEYMRADLTGANLTGANLHGATLTRAGLTEANLYGADLTGANLYRANLHGATLTRAGLTGANLHGATLTRAGLTEADLTGANLYGANLTGANLTGANLYGADLTGANLTGANLTGADLTLADLTLAKGDLIEYRTGKILTENIIGYKKCKDGIIVTLEIPRGALVFSINGIKCRTNKAKVISIDNAQRAISYHYNMSYYVGDDITVYDFNCEYNMECGKGIHFFMNREDAIKYGKI